MQFSLRAMFLVTAAAALLAHRWELVLHVALGLALEFWWFTFVVFLLGAFALGRRLSSRLLPVSSGLLRRSLAGGLLVLSLLWLGATHWSRQIWVVPPVNLPRPLPYPDGFLWALHAWLDSLYPASNGGMKISGEYFRGLAILNLGVGSGCLAGGFLLGLWAESCHAWLLQGECCDRFTSIQPPRDCSGTGPHRIC